MGGGICELLRGEGCVGCRKITSGYRPGEGKEVKWCCMLSCESNVRAFTSLASLSCYFVSSGWSLLESQQESCFTAISLLWSILNHTSHVML